MNANFRTPIIALVLGGVLGCLGSYLLVSSTAEPSATEARAETSNSESLKDQISLLESSIDSLQDENRRLRDRCRELENPSEPESDRATVMDNLKDEWIQEAIRNIPPSGIKKVAEELAEYQRRYNLTADQMTQLKLLLERREQNRRITMLWQMGMISEEDFRAQSSTLRAFDLDQEVQNLLSDEQKERYLAYQEARQNRNMNIAANVLTERYNIINPERFSTDQQAAIQEVFKRAYRRDSEVKIPASIRDLDIGRVEKRILALGAQELDDETFTKMYESLVEHRKDR